MSGDHEHPTIMLKAVASHDLLFWHTYFGLTGSNNDINVLHQSPIFDDVYDGIASECPFQVNNVTYKHEYYLVDRIYTEWAILVKAFTALTGENDKNSRPHKNRHVKILNELLACLNNVGI